MSLSRKNNGLYEGVGVIRLLRTSLARQALRVAARVVREDAPAGVSVLRYGTEEAGRLASQAMRIFDSKGCKITAPEIGLPCTSQY